MSLPSSASRPLKDWSWESANVLAVAAAAVMCVGLLGRRALLRYLLPGDLRQRPLLALRPFSQHVLERPGRAVLVSWSGDWRFLFARSRSYSPGWIVGRRSGGNRMDAVSLCSVPGGLGWCTGCGAACANCPYKGSRQGYGVLVAGLLLYVLGYLAENYYIGIVALQVVYAGLIVLFLGWRFMRELFFPWAFLLFMWPYGFFEDIAFELRMLMSSLSHHVLLLMGVANVLNGTAIVSPPGQTPPFGIDIADPCSGIRSLFALVMVAALAAFVLFRHAWQKAIIVAASIPLVIVGNLVRILLLTPGNDPLWRTICARGKRSSVVVSRGGGLRGLLD